MQAGSLNNQEKSAYREFMPADFIIIGHRGAAGERFENTIEGFNHTLSIAPDAIELDIQEHNNELWVFHDDDMDRLTESAGPFSELDDVSKVRLNNGQPIPKLSEVLDLCWGKIALNIEAKSIANPQLLLDLLESYGELNANPVIPWILLSSFDHNVLFDLKQRGCRWPLAPIDEAIPDNIDSIIERLAPYSCHFDDDQLDFEKLALLHRAGVRSFIYTVNSIERANQLKESGVAGIFTDYPSHF
ncbi:MAG: glycerophosphoryl diester phosphodiesterase [Planctomycetota bacterium]